MRRTKIVCTLGPSANTEEAIKSLALAGMNVARLNFSHGDFEEHGGRFERLKKVCNFTFAFNFHTFVQCLCSLSITAKCHL